MDTCTPLDLFYDDLDWIERNCCIITKGGAIEPMRFNYAQQKAIKACIKQLGQGKPIRIVCLKARQLGISTFIQALLFARSARRAGVRGVLIAHQDDSTKKIWRMQSVFAARSGCLSFVKSFAEADGPLVWNHNSRLSCMTAGGKDIAHGETITFLHLSEASRYGEGQSPDQQARVVQTITGVNAAVAKTPDSAVFIESTANGYGNWFEGMWHKAKAGEIDYEPVFIAWFENPEYTRPLSMGPIYSESSRDSSERPDGLDPSEIALRDHFGLALEQLNWRRYTIANDCNGDERLFREQYPATDEEAFLVSGSTVFDTEWIEGQLNRIKQPIWEGDIHYDAPAGWTTVPEKNGPLKVYEWPSKDDPFDDAYCVAADTAMCLDTRSDRDAAVVRSARTRQVVATIAGHWEPGVFAEKLAALGYRYREALLVPERNHQGSGLPVIGALTGKLGGPQIYWNIYRYERVDRVTGATQLMYGFQTTEETKKAAVEAQQRLIREDIEDCRCREILVEAKTFINIAHGKMGAQPGCRDDLVMAWCISAQAIGNVSIPVKEQPKPKTVTDLLNRHDHMTSEDLIGQS